VKVAHGAECAEGGLRARRQDRTGGLHPNTKGDNQPFDALVSAAIRENGWVNWSELAFVLEHVDDGLSVLFMTLLHPLTLLAASEWARS
jgi:hypothetical protein